MTSEKKRQSRAAFKEANEIAEGATAYLAAGAATGKEGARVAAEVPYNTRASRAVQLQESINSLQSLVHSGENLMMDLGITIDAPEAGEKDGPVQVPTVYSVLYTAASQLNRLECEVHSIFECIRDQLT